MVELSKCVCLYVFMCDACTLVWNQEKICLWLCLRLIWGDTLRLHHNSHSWDFSHSWDLSCHCFYTVTSLIGYHCIPWSWLTPVHSIDVQLDSTNVTIRIILYLHYMPFLLITLLLVSHSDVAVPCALCTSLLLVFCGNGTDLPLCCLHNSDTCILQIWCVSSSVHPSQLCYLYYAVIAYIFLWFTHISYCYLCTYLL